MNNIITYQYIFNKKLYNKITKLKKITKKLVCTENENKCC